MYCTSKHLCDFRNGWLCKMRQSCNIPCCSAYFYESNCAFQSPKALDFQVRSRFRTDCQPCLPTIVGAAIMIVRIQHLPWLACMFSIGIHNCGMQHLKCTGVHLEHHKCCFMTIHKEIWIFEQERLDPSSKLYTKRVFLQWQQSATNDKFWCICSSLA